MYTAKIRVRSDNTSDVIAALMPEAGRELPRTKAKVGMDGDDGIIELSTADASAMRAALNSYLECIRITEEINNIAR